MQMLKIRRLANNQPADLIVKEERSQDNVQGKSMGLWALILVHFVSS